MKRPKASWRIEETVRSLKFPSHVIMRPVFFMENLPSPWFLHDDKLISAIQPSTGLFYRRGTLRA